MKKISPVIQPPNLPKRSFEFEFAEYESPGFLIYFKYILDLPDMYNFCLLVSFSGEKAQILHTWKIQFLRT